MNEHTIEQGLINILANISQLKMPKNRSKPLNIISQQRYSDEKEFADLFDKLIEINLIRNCLT